MSLISNKRGYTQHDFTGHYVYLLKSVNHDEYYIGSTNDLKERLAEHNDGKSFHTSKYMPWTLEYYEAFKTEKLARERERALKKHGNAKRELKKRAGVCDENKTVCKNHAGYTLVELIVALGLFAAFSTVVIVSFVTFANIQGKTSTMKDSQQKLRVALDQIIRQTKEADSVTLSGTQLDLGFKSSPTIPKVVRYKIEAGRLDYSECNISSITASYTPCADIDDAVPQDMLGNQAEAGSGLVKLQAGSLFSWNSPRPTPRDYLVFAPGSPEIVALENDPRNNMAASMRVKLVGKIMYGSNNFYNDDFTLETVVALGDSTVANTAATTSQTVTLSPEGDTNTASDGYLTADLATFESSFTTLTAGDSHNSSFGMGLPLIHFNLTDIPSGSIVTSANLKFTVVTNYWGGGPGDNRYYPDTSSTFSVWRMLKGWKSPAVGWYPHQGWWSGEGASGSGDTHTDPTATSNSIAVQGAIAGSTVSWDVKADVQLWVNGTTNFGWKIRPDSYWDRAADNLGQAGLAFASSRHGEADKRPKLEVTYILP